MACARIWLALMACAAIAAAPARTATVAAEYTNKDWCPPPSSVWPPHWFHMDDADNNAEDFVQMMEAYGHTRKFVYGNENFWPGDLVSRTVAGGADNLYADNANVLFVTGYGTSSFGDYGIKTGSKRPVAGTETCISRLNYPYNNWMLGDGQLRILCLLASRSLRLDYLRIYNPVANGLHLITGCDGNIADVPNVGYNVAYFGNCGMTVKQTWFFNTRVERPVVMAFGDTKADALNRRDNERFTWGMARLQNKAYRAWSWID